LSDIAEKQLTLEPGMTLLLVDGELSADGRVEWNEAERLWVDDRVRSRPGALRKHWRRRVDLLSRASLLRRLGSM